MVKLLQYQESTTCLMTSISTDIPRQMGKISKSILALLLGLPFLVTAQTPVPEKGPVFRDDVVPRIDIIIPQSSLDFILAPENGQSYEEFEATFIFDNTEIRDTVENVGFRLRGNTSRASAKKSFKVSFNTFIAGGDYYGLEKLNINGEHNDPGIIRSKLAWDVLNAIGIPAPRANHVTLYINNEYYGLYINVEHIDEEFAGLRFGSKDGNLYKCLWPADLAYQGPNPDDYKGDNGDRRTYDLKTNTALDDYSDLANFISVLNNTPVETLPTALEKIFNVNGYLQNLALEVMIGHWDAYSYLKNNYYLYNNPLTGKFEYITYDTDNTFGVDWIGRDWGTRSIYSWSKGGEERPLYERLMDVPEYRDRFSYYVNQLLASHLNPDTIEGRIYQLKGMITSFAENDPLRGQDWGYSASDFHDSYTQALGGHVAYGLIPFIETRYNFVSGELELNNLRPVIWGIERGRIIENEPIQFSSRIEDEGDIQAVFFYSINESAFEEVALKDDGLDPDPAAGDNLYTAAIGGIARPASLRYYVEATDGEGGVSRYPREDYESFDLMEADIPSLFINEFMASNDKATKDNAGEFDDWIEIFNAGTESVWLGNKYLTDNPGRPDKWQMPDMEIGPEEFVLFWADEDQNQGEKHTNFKLSRDGEHIGIYFGEEFAFQVIDAVDFTQAETDVAIGRSEDGFGGFGPMNWPTPGRSNLSPLGLSEVPRLVVYPNPAKCELHVVFPEGSGEILHRISISDMAGRQVYQRDEFREEITLQVHTWKSGIYLLRITDSKGRSRTIKFIKR